MAGLSPDLVWKFCRLLLYSNTQLQYDVVLCFQEGVLVEVVMPSIDQASSMAGVFIHVDLDVVVELVL